MSLRRGVSPLPSFILSIDYKGIDDTYNIIYSLVKNHDHQIETVGGTDRSNHMQLSDCVLEFSVDAKYYNDFKLIMDWDTVVEDKYYCRFREFFHNANPSIKIRRYLQKFFVSEIL